MINMTGASPGNGLGGPGILIVHIAGDALKLAATGDPNNDGRVDSVALNNDLNSALTSSGNGAGGPGSVINTIAW